ncbi:uncharacterized LOC100382063 [Zea mays]|uniref:Uncharacterized protein n=2 Tax=Zea mays TaxID=4577 RepID=C0P417_MAIZE|eukprot:NP_001168298.1 uncharacterized protein LOC100382063 [Zea mays]
MTSSSSTNTSDGAKPSSCRRGHWRPGEDEKLKQLVNKYGAQKWKSIAEKLEGRSGRSDRQELPAQVVQPAGPSDQQTALHRTGGRAAAQRPPRPRQQVGAHRPPLTRPHGQRRQEPLACRHGASLPRALQAPCQGRELQLPSLHQLVSKRNARRGYRRPCPS